MTIEFGDALENHSFGQGYCKLHDMSQPLKQKKIPVKFYRRTFDPVVSNPT